MATTVTRISESPWHGDSSRYTVEEWKSACLIDSGVGDPDSKSRYKLPVRLPDGTLSRAGTHAAAQRLSSVDCSPEQKASAAKKLLGLYHTLGEQPPNSLLASKTRNHTTEGGTAMSKGMAPREVENRATPLEIRSIGSGLPKIAGYAAVFSPARSQDLGGFVEVVENRAFVKSQNDGWPMVRATYEHRDLLGTVAAGTLRLSTDSKGLEYEVDLPETSTGRDVYALTQRGDLRSSSWSFQVYDQDFTYENGTTVRHLTSVRLLEVSAVSNPAYPDATLGLRSLAAQFSCDPEDVFTMARSNQLSKLFVRTDTPRKSGRQALLELMKLKPNGEYHKPLTPARARAQLTRLMTPPPCEAMTPQQQYLARLPYETASSIGYDE